MATTTPPEHHRSRLELPPIPPGSDGAPCGMYRLAGHLFLRRFAPVRPHHVTCRLGHAVTIHGRPLTGTQQCDYHDRPGNQRCPAHIYVVQITDLRYWLLDVTREEAGLIHRVRASVDDVIAWFGLDLQPPL